MDSLSPLGSALLAGAAFTASAVAWVAYFRWKDRERPEPWVLLWLMVGGGLVSALLSLAGYEGLDALGVGTAWEQLAAPSLRESFGAALRIGAVEESVKLLPVAALALTHRHFDEVLDGVVYAACVGLGFASAENLALFGGGQLSGLETAARAVAAPLTHALFATPLGLGLALAVLQRRVWAAPLGLGVSIAAHALFDWLLARPGLPPASSAGVVLLLWLGVLLLTPRLARLPATRR